MEVIYRLGQATAMQVREEMANPPSYSAVRAQLAILEDKGFVKHHQEGKKYVYAPTVSPDRAKRSALKSLLATFFDSSASRLVASLLDPTDSKLPPEEIDRIKALVREAEEAER